MSTQTASVQETLPEEPRVITELQPLIEVLHKFVLAGVGAAVLTQEEIKGIVKKLVERGEIAEKKGQKRLHKVVDPRVKEFLARANIPTRSDIQTLSRRITNLTKKVDELIKS